MSDEKKKAAEPEPVAVDPALLAEMQATLERAAKAAEEANARAERAEQALVERESTEPAGMTALLERLVAAQEREPVARSWAAHESVENIVESLANTVVGDLETDDRLEVPVTFRSKGINFVAIRKPRRRTTGANGEAQTSQGVLLDFAPRGELTTDSKQNVEFLRGLRSYNTEFWEVGKEPHAPPSPEKVFEEIAQAIGELDDAKLAALEQAERAGDNRVVVLQSIAAAKKTVQGMAPAA